MMLDGSRQNLNWNVVIENARTPLGHVYAFAHDPFADVWIVVDPHFRWTEIYALKAGEQFDRWVRIVSEGADIYRLRGRGNAPVLPGWFCVAQVKRLIGLRSGALSPEGLRRDLLRAGAQQVFQRESQNPQGRPAHQVGA